MLTDEFGGKKIIETNDRIIQKYEPVYMKPVAHNGRAHFYSPYKQLGDRHIDTFWFNITLLWCATILLYIALYFKLLNRAVSSGFPVKALRRNSK